MNSVRILRIAKNGYITMSLIFCLFGLFLILQPDCSAKLLCTVAGVIFIANGIIKIVGYLSRDLYNLAFQFDLALGILTCIVGILILLRGEMLIKLIFVILGIMILADALFRIQMSLDARRFGLGIWWRILVVAIFTGVFGTILLLNPYGGARMTIIFSGVTFLLEGILSLCVAIYTVKCRKEYKEEGKL